MNFETASLKEKKSGLNRVVGTNQDIQAQQLEVFASFKEGLREDVDPEKKQYEKLVTFLNQELKAFLVGYGLEEAQDFTIADVVVDQEKIQQSEDKNTQALYDSVRSKLIVEELPESDSLESQARFLGNLTHEMIHGQSFQSCVITDVEGQGYMPVARRLGVAMNLRKREWTESEGEKMTVGRWINEALTENLNVLFHRHLLTLEDQPDLYPYSEQYLEQSTRVYPDERLALLYLIQSLQKHFPEKYPTDEDVERLFFKAVLNGRLLPVARLIEQKMGKDAFRDVLSDRGRIFADVFGETKSSL